ILSPIVLEFKLTAVDNLGFSVSDHVQVSVTSSLPVANNDSLSMTGGGTMVIDVLANDVGDGLAIDSYSGSTLGTVTVSLDNTLIYTAPISGGIDTFTYKLIDRFGFTSEALATITSATPTIVTGTPDYDDFWNFQSATGPLAIWGYSGADHVVASSYNDVIIGGPGDDWLVGGLGDDEFKINGINDGINGYVGGAGIDRIMGSNDDDVIGMMYLEGVELIDGLGGFNIIRGSDWVSPEGGYTDRLDFTNVELRHINRIEMGAGDDEIIGSSGNDVIDGGPGVDSIYGGPGDDTILVNGNPSEYDAWYHGDEGYDVVLGTPGDDVIKTCGLYTIEKVDGGLGTNTFIWDSCSSTDGINLSSYLLEGVEFVNIHRFEGTEFNDNLNLDKAIITNGIEISTGAGHDGIIGSTGNDLIIPGPGNDVVGGGNGTDTVRFTGAFETFSIVFDGSGYTVRDLEPAIDGDDGTDYIRIDVEVLEFKGGFRYLP
ncbi:MAG: Ig-like domain-containing protein, partial [Gammaproteobacteria bacterium]|nr:Ig-like domain-containing protein [Gammaproteobacteria bacterium]